MDPKTYQNALVELRRRMGLTQQKLANALNVTATTASRWETSYAPRGYALVRLQRFARSAGHEDLAQAFDDTRKEIRDDPAGILNGQAEVITGKAGILVVNP